MKRVREKDSKTSSLFSFRPGLSRPTPTRLTPRMISLGVTILPSATWDWKGHLVFLMAGRKTRVAVTFRRSQARVHHANDVIIHQEERIWCIVRVALTTIAQESLKPETIPSGGQRKIVCPSVCYVNDQNHNGNDWPPRQRCSAPNFPR